MLPARVLPGRLGDAGGQYKPAVSAAEVLTMELETDLVTDRFQPSPAGQEEMFLRRTRAPGRAQHNAMKRTDAAAPCHSSSLQQV